LSGKPSESSAFGRSTRFSRWSSPFMTSTFRFSESIESDSTYSSSTLESTEARRRFAAHMTTPSASSGAWRS
jgi:hypothetical protein